MEKSQKIIRGELALMLVIVINSLGIVLMLYSGSGISAISSVPYAFSEVLPILSLGTWTYIFQGLLIFILMVLRKKFIPQYMFSFVVGFLFGIMVDIHETWVNTLPLFLPLRFLYFAAGYFMISFGIALSNRCKLPIIPTDLFPRELSYITKKAYSKINDKKYRYLLIQQNNFIQLNTEKIRETANKLYKFVTVDKKEFFVNICCDFRMLEQKSKEYKK